MEIRRLVLFSCIIAAFVEAEKRTRRVTRQAETPGSCGEKITAYFTRKDKVIMDPHPVIIRNVTTTKCIEMCTDGEDLKGKAVDCSTAMYDPKLKHCMMSSKKPMPIGKTDLKSVKGIMTFEKMCLDPDIAPESCSESLFMRESNAYLVGHASAATVTETIEHCVEMCMVTDGCKSALYYYEDNECVMNSATSRNSPKDFVHEKTEKVEYFENVCHTEARTTKKSSAEADAPEEEENAAVEEQTTSATKAIVAKRRQTTTQTTQAPKLPPSPAPVDNFQPPLAPPQVNPSFEQPPFQPFQPAFQAPLSPQAPASFLQQPLAPPETQAPFVPPQQPSVSPAVPIIEALALNDDSLGAWGDWSQCDFVTGLKFRARECKVPLPERCRASKLVESVPCGKDELAAGEWGPWSSECEVIISSPCVGIQERKCRGQRCKGPITRYCFPESCSTTNNQGGTILRDSSK